jgi:hypothetical protein
MGYGYQNGSPARFPTHDQKGNLTGRGPEDRVSGPSRALPVGPQFTQLEMFINPREMGHRTGYQPHTAGRGQRGGRSPARTKGLDTREDNVVLDAPHVDGRGKNRMKGVSVVRGQKTINSATGRWSRDNWKDEVPVSWKSRPNNPEWAEAEKGSGPSSGRFDTTPANPLPSRSEQKWADARIAVKGQMELPGMEAQSADPVKRLMHNPAVERMNNKI